MSKRYPLSRATRELNRLLDVAGFSEEGIADASCDLSDVALSPDPARREAVARAVMALESCGEATGSEFAWISRWAACKQVYRIDPEVAASLKGQPLDGSLPAEALMRLPYPHRVRRFPSRHRHVERGLRELLARVGLPGLRRQGRRRGAPSAQPGLHPPRGGLHGASPQRLAAQPRPSHDGGGRGRAFGVRRGLLRQGDAP